MTHWLWSALKSLTAVKQPPVKEVSEHKPEPKPLPFEKVDIFGTTCVGVRDSCTRCYWGGSVGNIQLLVHLDDIEMEWCVEVDVSAYELLLDVTGRGNSIVEAERDAKQKLRTLVSHLEGLLCSPTEPTSTK